MAGHRGLARGARIVAVERGKFEEIGVNSESVGIEPQKLAIGHRNDQQPAVGQPAEARGPVRNFRYGLGAAIQVDVHDFEALHVGKPELAVMPAFSKCQTIEQRLYFRMWSLPLRQIANFFSSYSTFWRCRYEARGASGYRRFQTWRAMALIIEQ